MPDWLVAGGDAGERLRAFNWSSTSMGPLRSWPQSLRTAVNLMLAAQQPMYIAWGTELWSMYNDSYLPIVGDKHPAAMGQTFQALWSEIWKEYRPYVEAVMAGEAQFWVDQPFMLSGRPNRPIGWFTCSWTPLRDEQGNVAGFLSVGTETTERVLAERQLVESMDEAYCVIEIENDRHGAPVDYRFVSINPAFMQQTGLSNAQGKRVTKLVPGIERHWIERYGQVALTGKPIRFINESLAMGRWFDVYAFRLASNSNQVGLLFRDITEHKKTVEQLRIREERYRALLDSIDEAFCIIELIFDGDGKPVDHRFIETNSAYEKHTGLRNVAGKRAKELAPDIEQRWNDIYAQVAATGQSMRIVEYATPLKRWFDVFISKVHEETDARLAIVFRDITSQKKANEELRQVAAELSRANQRQNEFLATLAHELRNPLAPLRTGLDLMRISPDSAASGGRVREMMERQVNQLVHLVDDLLDLARINSGKIELKKSRITVKDIILSAVETALPGMQAKRHRFSLEVPDEPVWLNADPHRLAQVVGNILNNAAKYTPECGAITLQVQKKVETVSIEIQDNGIGIPSRSLSGIFDMFSQVERDGHNLQGGLGIGLNLVKRLTEMHGGTVMAASEGSGSTFTIELPTTNEINEPDNKKQINTGASEPQVPLTILIADDNQDAADMLREILETGGHVIHVAHEGYEALEKARQYRPDLALLDIGMPGMSGHELAYKIRNELRLQNTVLIAITGWGTQEDRSKSRDFGFDHHLTKPVDFASLNCLLSKLRPSS